MSAILGMKGTGEFTSDEMPGNYRDMLLYLEPNTVARLTALTGRLKSEDTDHPVFNIFTKLIPDQQTKARGVTASGSTTLLVTLLEQTKFKKGSVILEVNTGEIMWCSTDPTTTGEVPVTRACGTVVATDTVDLDEIIIIGTEHAEGQAVPTSLQYSPGLSTNYTQIFRTAVELTETARASRTRYGDAWKEASREALEIHGMEMEKAFLFGDAKVTTGSNSKPVRTTRGLANWISTNTADFTSSGVSEDSWDDFLAGAFKYGSKEKLCLCGNRALAILNRVAKRNSAIYVTPETKTYGLAVQTWVVTNGVLQLVNHPLLSESTLLSRSGFIIDTKNLRYRPLRTRDTAYLPNRQNPGDDTRKDEYRTECGIEVQFEQAFGFFEGANAYTGS